MLADAAPPSDVLGWALIGITTIVTALAAAVGALWRRLERLNEAHAAKIESLMSDHAKVERATTERYHEAMLTVTKAIDALTDALSGGRR